MTGQGPTTHAERERIPFWKRAFDLACILATVPFWFPLMVVLAIWIKTLSKGPVLFRQERIGFRGRKFTCLKFRSMKVNAETISHEEHFEQLIRSGSPMVKLDRAGDSRLIPSGRLFRATGLDELPQILNVIRGEMSLVGPRPCTPREFALYGLEQRERVNVPPGLTGNWQVNGKNKTTFSEMIDLDVDYARNCSLLWDAAIILRTLPVLIGQISECRMAAGTAPQETVAQALETVGK